MKRDLCTAIVFSALMLMGPLQGAAQAPRETVKTNGPAEVFQFGGGHLNQFLTKLRDQFGKEVYELIEIRGADADRLQIPKMRIQMSSGVTDIRRVLFTYNRISAEGDGFLGEWIYSPTATPTPNSNSGQRLEAIVFVGPRAGGVDGTAGIQVRAFSVRNISEDSLKELRDLISEQSHLLQRAIAERAGDISAAEGRVSVHQGTGLLIASGGKTYVELVGTLMDALQRQKGNMF